MRRLSSDIITPQGIPPGACRCAHTSPRPNSDLCEVCGRRIPDCRRRALSPRRILSTPTEDTFPEEYLSPSDTAERPLLRSGLAVDGGQGNDLCEDTLSDTSSDSLTHTEEDNERLEPSAPMEAEHSPID